MAKDSIIDYLVEHVASKVEAKLRAKVATALQRGPVSETALHRLAQHLVNDAFDLVRAGFLAAPSVDLRTASAVLELAHSRASNVMRLRASAVLGSAIDDWRARTP